MTISGEDISRITNLLKLRPRGMSIAAIAKELRMNRNSVAKYLDLLTASGAVELTRVGPAKLYFTAPRLPVSGMINLSSDYFIMLDADLGVLYVNNNVLAFEGRTRPEVLHKSLEGLSLALVANDEIQRYLHSAVRDEIFQRDVQVRKGEETFHFRVKIISTVYENGTQGTTILASDITTETEQQKALQASEAEYRGVVEDQTELIFRFRPDRIFTFANDAFLRVVGKRREEVVGVPATFPVLDEDMVKIRQAYGSLSMDHPLTTLQHRVTHADGTIHWMQVNFRAFFDEHGNPWEYQAVARDITDLKAAEDAIAESEARYRAVVESQQEGIIRFTPDGIFTFVNAAFCRFIGRTLEEIVGSNVTHFVTDEDMARIRMMYRTLTPEHPTTIIEFRARRLDGAVRWIQGDFQAFFDDRGAPVEYQSVSRDVTDLKAAEERIRESEARYRAVVDEQLEVVFRYRPDGIFTFANDAYCQFLGRSRDEIVGSNQIFPLRDEDVARIRETYRSLTPSHSTIIVEHRATRADGEIRWMQATIRALFDDRGTPQEYQVVARDVTDLKVAERAIQESEARYRAVVEDQTEWIVRFRSDGIFTFANDAFCRAVGKGREEMVGKPFALPLSDKEYTRTQKAYRSLTPEHSSTSLEVRVTTTDGMIRFVEVTFRALFDERGDPQEYQAVGRDITDRKKAEELASVELQSFPVPTYIVRQRGKDLICADYNEAAHQETGGAVSQLIGRPARDLFREYPSILANLERCLATKTTIDEEIHYTYTVTGKERDLIIRYAYLPPDGVLVYAIDITERSAAENQLRERVKELRLLYEVSRLIDRDGKDLPVLLQSIVRLVPGAFRYPDLAAARIIYQGKEYASENFASTPWGIREDIAVNGVAAGSIEVQYLTRPLVAGEDVFIPEEHALVDVIAERLGRIGEQIDAEAAVRDHVHLVTELLDRIPIPVYYVDTHGVFLGTNLAFEALAGVPRGKIIGRTAAMVWPDKHTSQFEVTTQQLLRNGGIRRDEMVLPMGGEESLHVILTRAPFHGMDGTVNGIVATIQNVTELKHAERALQASEEQFREMAENSPFPISIVDGDGRYRYLNRRFTDLFGYTLDDMPTGRRWFEQAFPDPGLRREAVTAWKRDLAGSRPGMVRPRQFPVSCRNGECREVIFRPVTLRDGTQYITYEDVTERLHTMASLRQSEARFKHLFNSMRCCFTLVEPVLDGKGMPVDLTFLEVNTAMERLSGRIQENLVGQQLRDLFPHTPLELIEAIGAVALTGDPKKLVVYHPDLDRNLKIRAYSPWKGQCALIFKVEPPAGNGAPGQAAPPGKGG